MNRCSISSVLTAVVMAVGAFLLVGCGGAGVDREALKEQILTRLETDTDTSAEMATCFANTIDQLSDSELSALNSSAVPQEVQDKLVTLLTPCMTGPTGSAEPSS